MAASDKRGFWVSQLPVSRYLKQLSNLLRKQLAGALVMIFGDRPPNQKQYAVRHASCKDRRRKCACIMCHGQMYSRNALQLTVEQSDYHTLTSSSNHNVPIFVD
jgi:hypothetical protein